MLYSYYFGVVNFIGCSFHKDVGSRDNRAELWLSFTLITFLIPLFLVMFCYICIFKAARKQFGKILGNYDENIKVRNMQNVKAIKTVSFVLGVYIITWIPSLVLQSAHRYYMATNHRRNDVKLNVGSFSSQILTRISTELISFLNLG